MVGHLSLIATPLVFFLSSSFSLYLKNQADLGYDYTLLAPFAAAFVLLWGCGALLYHFRSNETIRKWLVAYYLFCPLWLGLGPVIAESRTPVYILVLIGVLFALSHRPYRLLKLKMLTRLFLYISVALIGVEGYNFATRYQVEVPVEQAEARIAQPESDNFNIYHILLDEYQTELFEMTVEQEGAASFNGFTFYSDNISNYLATDYSVPSTFLGQEDVKDIPYDARMSKAFGSPASMLSILRDRGYALIASGIKRSHAADSLFEYTNVSTGTPQGEVDNHRRMFFIDYWLVNVLPLSMAKLLAEGEVVKAKEVNLRTEQQTHNLPILGFASVHASLEVFNRFLPMEQTFPNKGRYSYIYLLPPHSPYFLNGLCEIEPDFAETSPLEQAQCARLLAIRFLETLKKLGRFKDSMIIIHADHGSNLVRKGDSLETMQQGRSPRSLLLIKYPGVGDSLPMKVSDLPTTNLDIFPTIFHAMGGAMPKTDGIPVQDMTAEMIRDRYFYRSGADFFNAPTKRTPYAKDNLQFDFKNDFMLESEQAAAGRPAATVGRTITADQMGVSSRTVVTQDDPKGGTSLEFGFASFYLDVEEDGLYMIRSHVKGRGRVAKVYVNGSIVASWDYRRNPEWQWRTFSTPIYLTKGRHLVTESLPMKLSGVKVEKANMLERAWTSPFMLDLRADIPITL